MKKQLRKDFTAGLDYEQHAQTQGYSAIAGIDEAGRGPWAGPVVAGMVALPLDDPQLLAKFHGVHDSKKTTPRQRESLAKGIKANARAWGIGSASASEISTHGLMTALKLAYQRACDDAKLRFNFMPDFLLLDFTKWQESKLPQQNITRGDMLSLSIASASILAKQWRDEWIVTELVPEYPYYGFERHKGYGTTEHKRALEAWGATPVHRTNFAPVKAHIKS